MTDTRPSRRRRRWVVPALLLGVGAWVVVARRSVPEADDVWTPRPRVEGVVVPSPAPLVAQRAQPARPAEPASAAAARPDASQRVRPVKSPAAAPSPAAPSPAAPSPAAAPSPEAVPSPAAPPTPVAPGPHGPGSAFALPDGSAPGPDFTIKGNAGSGLFHPPSSPYYGRTKAEVWFRTAEDATAAGYSPYRSRRR